MARLFLALLLAAPAFAQSISVAGGGVFSQDMKANASATGVSPTVSDFSKTSIVTGDLGLDFIPIFGTNIHYSFARPELFLRRGDAFDSSALLDVGTHTITFDGQVRSGERGGFRVYGFAGGGVSRSNLSIRQVVENPFASQPPDSVTYPVFTFGGGVTQRLAPLVRLKFEVRDYVAPIPSRFFIPGGIWHRIAVVGGIRIGR